MPITFSNSASFCRQTLSSSIDNAIAGLTADDSTKLIFSTQTPNGGVNPVYVRSTTCWAKNIDLSPLSPWNSAYLNEFAGTLISPRHIVGANHAFPATGATIIFVDMNNICYTRTLMNQSQVGSTDIKIGVLDSDLPANISFCQVASLELANFSTYSNRVAGLFVDKEEKALVGDFYNNDFGSYDTTYVVQPTNSQRLSFYEAITGGDSGNPAGFVYNNKFILLTTFWHSNLISSADGSSIPYNISGINSVMASLGGGYSLSVFNKTDIKSEVKRISVKKTNTGGGRLILNKK